MLVVMTCEHHNKTFLQFPLQLVYNDLPASIMVLSNKAIDLQATTELIRIYSPSWVKVTKAAKDETNVDIKLRLNAGKMLRYMKYKPFLNSFLF